MEVGLIITPSLQMKEEKEVKKLSHGHAAGVWHSGVWRSESGGLAAQPVLFNYMELYFCYR